MIPHFIDSSALVKLFIYEPGTEKMIAFYTAEDDRNKIVSVLAEIEARSAICRLRYGKAITAAEASVALNSLDKEMKRLIQQPIPEQILLLAQSLVERHLLRALDAVQLASALYAQSSLSAVEMRFISSDKELLSAAEREGLRPWNPCG